MESPTLTGSSKVDEVERVAYLFRQVPPMIATSLIGIFLVFVFLYEPIGAANVKAWVAYMASVLAAHGWLWYAHGNAAVTSQSARRWEYLAAFGALLLGMGWGSLSGPLVPEHDMNGGHFVMLMTAVIAFSIATYYSLSPLTFSAGLLPILLPIGLHLAHSAKSPLDGPVMTVVALLGVVLILQRIQFTTVMENLHRRVESEMLLAEQQAIFQSASQGIALVHGAHIVKCNHRLGEMLGRRLQELYALGFAEHFVDHAEFDVAMAAGREAFSRNRTYHGLVRLRRADGSEFWAELSGGRMHGEDAGRSVWLIGEVSPQTTCPPRPRH